MLRRLKSKSGRKQTPPVASPATTPNPTIADAICDRLVHNAHVLTLRGSSMRRQKGLNVAIPYRPSTGALHLLIDSTGRAAKPG